MPVFSVLCLQWVAQVSQFPGSGETIRATHASSHAGGRGARQALAASHLGASVSLIAPMGKDYLADSLRQNLAQHRIDIHGLVPDEHAAPGAEGDATQAGDLFTAAFAVALALGRTELTAGKFAVAAATAQLWRPAHPPHFPSLHEVENLIKPHTHHEAHRQPRLHPPS